VPVTPNATAQARNVLCYLYSQYGNHILSGQEESGAEVEIDYIHTNTGKYPAIRSFEANGDGAATRCISYWNAGGLCMFGYHMGAPSTADGYTGSMTAVTGGIDSVLTVGSANNTVFNQRLDALAKRLATVQAAGGVVIFRPFHEAGGTWFWWSMEGGAQYIRLWKYAFDRVVNTNGVKNAIWLLPYDGSPNAAFDPGAGYVDIGGADNYNKAYDYDPMTSIYTKAKGIFGASMPIALHECGPVPDPDLLQSSKTNWVFFSIWTQPYPEQDSTVAELQKVYGSSYVVTRDQLPTFK
jgi:beta-mannanase